MNDFSLMITANSPRITDQVGPLIADAQHLDGLIIVFLPDPERFLASPSPSADRQLAGALRTLAEKYPNRKLGLVGWYPTIGPWPESSAFLLDRDFHPLWSGEPDRLVEAWQKSTRRN
jgi:hypothetical protein